MKLEQERDWERIKADREGDMLKDEITTGMRIGMNYSETTEIKRNTEL